MRPFFIDTADTAGILCTVQYMKRSLNIKIFRMISFDVLIIVTRYYSTIKPLLQYMKKRLFFLKKTLLSNIFLVLNLITLNLILQMNDFTYSS
jgi:hypothetical protein